ncbi:ATP-dependent zinc protease [Gallaecimonas sp. GXIMD4217]|uniref:ATP-dependent zinc protease family protein n=1 Tax=Gallaecimonas sp. GXIMD4217 TaxID=3131927 RepID=UPI00311ABC6C
MRKALLASGLLLLQGCAPGVWLKEADMQQLQGQLEQVQSQHQQTQQQLTAYQAQREDNLLAAMKTQEEHLATLSELKANLEKTAKKAVVCPPAIQPKCPEVKAMPVKDDKVVVGAVERVRLSPPDFVLEARIDTGATYASLDARDIETFERDGDDWVRFHVVLPDGTDITPIEKKVVRWVRILQSNTEEGERRPIVELRYQLGPVSQKAEFTLTDRSHLEYPLLIGRNILKDLMVVDVSREFSLKLPAKGKE